MTSLTTSTETDDVTQTDTETVTVTTDSWLTVTIPTTVTDVVTSRFEKRTLQQPQATVTPSSLPDYATKPCSANVTAYVSACLCYSATASITYAPTPVTTVTLTTDAVVVSTIKASTIHTDTTTVLATTTEVEVSTTTVPAATVTTTISPFHLHIIGNGYDSYLQLQEYAPPDLYLLAEGPLDTADIFALDSTTRNLFLPEYLDPDGVPLVLLVDSDSAGVAAGSAIAAGGFASAVAITCDIATATDVVTCNGADGFDTFDVFDPPVLYLFKPGYEEGVAVYAEAV